MKKLLTKFKDFKLFKKTDEGHVIIHPDDIGIRNKNQKEVNDIIDAGPESPETKARWKELARKRMSGEFRE